ncbi:hypothetical protein M378DRAFT_163268, partial [Amanita muscaria Koide BX008]
MRWTWEKTVRFAQSIYVKSFAASHWSSSESNPKRDRLYARMQPPLSMPSARPLTRFLEPVCRGELLTSTVSDSPLMQPVGTCTWALREVL